MPQRLRSPIRWFGGKGRLANRILPYIPPHHTWVEVFGGGASLTFAKSLAPVEVYNDLDEGLATFFGVLRDGRKFNRLHRMCLLTPYSRKWYHHCVDNWTSQRSDVMRAYMWYVVARMSFAGRFDEGFGFDVLNDSDCTSRTVLSWIRTLSNLRKIHTRFRSTIVECEDFRVILHKYDSPETLFYCDPPYVPCTRVQHGYRRELSDDDHRELVALLRECQGMVLLSGYENDIYRPLVEDDGWNVIRLQTSCHAAGRTRFTKILGCGAAMAMQPRTEVLWMNPQCMRRLWPLLY